MAAERAVYLDSSALVKLVVAEAESEALTTYLRTRPLRVASALVRVEVPRAVRRHGPRAIERAAALISPIRLLALDDGLLDAAASLDAVGLRSLDAIHLASAMTLAGDLEVLVTYDARLARAAGRVGITCDAPS